MVGLPARGKTHISVCLCRYLLWLGLKTRVFHLGDYRRQNLKKGEIIPEDYFYINPSEKMKKFRNSVLSYCKEDIIKFFDNEDGQVAIYDAANPQISDRRFWASFFSEKGIQSLFIESICDNPEIIEENIRSLKISSPDYISWKPEDVVKDYLKRINNKIPFYETIVINLSQKLIINNANIGYLPSRIIFYLMNLHVKPRTIYFVRICDFLYDDTNFKKDPQFNTKNLQYASALVHTLLKDHKQTQQTNFNKNTKDLTIWTPVLHKACLVTDLLQSEGYTVDQRPLLRQINLGMVEDMTMEEIEEKYPIEMRLYRENPYTHRFPRGESLHDLGLRLESVILEIEKENNDILIIAHASVINLLYAYFMSTSINEIPFLDLPKDYIIKIISGAYFCTETRIPIANTSSFNCDS
ncbi:hypothetical protein PORY_002458 [Pneumocystis oryctolagi]|uniref:Uncharacterized protein n=1 Tax=Pneumocystis oryctolagi TaxID=42067 RepID=A0ACB7CBA0_9ASCO|nr:hypothetical protein PORY_002458 [Pneumocystis oryctolagi]